MIFLAAFIFGAVIGSFLNVLVCRLPEGMSLVSPASHCPKCAHPIRPYDNIPILGWLVLRGRCRDCREPISVRYPIVELLTALLFVAVAVAEQNALSAEAVFVDANTVVKTSANPPADYLEGAGRYFYRVFLISGLWAALLMQLDGNRIPRRFFLVLFFIGCLPALFWPSLHPISAVSFVPSGPFAGGIDAASGAIPGLGLLALTVLLKARVPVVEGAAGLAVAGAFLGLYAAVVLGAFVLLDFLLIAGRGHRPLPLFFLPSAWLLLGSLAVLFQPPV